MGSGEVFMSDPATGNFSGIPPAAARGNWGVVFAPRWQDASDRHRLLAQHEHGPPDAEVWIYDVGRRRANLSADPGG